MHTPTLTPSPAVAPAAASTHVLDAATAAQARTLYAGAQGTPPEPTDLDRMATPTPWERTRQIWVFYGPVHVGTLQAVLERITECSRLVVCDARPAGQSRLTPEEMAALQKRLRDGRLQIVVGSDAEAPLKTLAGLIDINQADGWKPLVSEALLAQQTEAVRTFLRKVSGEVNIRVLVKATVLKGSLRVVRNVLLNAPLAQAPAGLQSLADSRSQKPALIVSAGPSLNKQLPTLAKHQDLFTIIAVDTVWPLLDRHGIVPDFLVALDPITPPSWPVNGISHHTCFVSSINACPQMVWAHDRGRVFSSSQANGDALMQYLGGHAGPLPVGGSVATMAFNLAVHLGANPIVFIGQDLALTDGRDHAEGYLYQYDEQELHSRSDLGYDVEGYHGGMVRTERQLLAYRDWFVDRIKTLPQLTVINATEGGARIAGTLQLPFAVVCEQIGMTSLRKPVHPPFEPHAIDPLHLATLRQRLAQHQASLQGFRSLALEAKAWAAGKKHLSAQARLQKIDRLNDDIRRYDPHAKYLADACSTREMEAIREEASKLNKRQATASAALARYALTYEHIAQSCDKGSELLDQIDALYAELERTGRAEPAMLERFFAD